MGSRGVKTDVTFLVVFALFVASLVYNATRVNERVQEARQPTLLTDLPQVPLHQPASWPSLLPPAQTRTGPRSEVYRDLFH